MGECTLCREARGSMSKWFGYKEKRWWWLEPWDKQSISITEIVRILCSCAGERKLVSGSGSLHLSNLVTNENSASEVGVGVKWGFASNAWACGKHPYYCSVTPSFCKLTSCHFPPLVSTPVVFVSLLVCVHCTTLLNEPSTSLGLYFYLLGASQRGQWRSVHVLSRAVSSDTTYITSQGIS